MTPRRLRRGAGWTRPVRATLLLAAWAAFGLAAPAAAQTIRPDPSDPASAEAARRWLDATLDDLDRGRKVIVPTPDGPLPYVIVDRSALSESHDLTALTGDSEREALQWSATVLRRQRELRAGLARTRDLALGGADDPEKGGDAPGPRIAVVRGTPDAPDPAPAGPGDGVPAALAPAGGDDPGDADPEPVGLGPDAAGGGGALASAGTADADPIPAPGAPAVAVAGGGGGVRATRSIGSGGWAAIGLALLAVLLGGALVAARRGSRSPTGAARPIADPRAKIDLALDLDGPAGPRSARFRAAPVVVGRDSASDLVIDDPRVSRRHARIVVDAGSLWIEDLGSRAGVEIDGRAVDRAVLASGTSIRLGDTTLRVR